MAGKRDEIHSGKFEFGFEGSSGERGLDGDEEGDEEDRVGEESREGL